uniref:Uncharacterized protein n=1 Tax=Rhizophora mucronata TaxID=61149 RepID=A0A2P2MIP0_RHIMU
MGNCHLIILQCPKLGRVVKKKKKFIKEEKKQIPKMRNML